MTRAMIQLSPRGQAIYQHLSLIVALLALYGIGFMLSALYHLPDPPLAHLVDASVLDATTATAMQLLILSGFLGAGVMMADEDIGARSLIWARRMWAALVFIALLISPLQLGLLIDGAIALALLLWLALGASRGGASEFLSVWRTGMMLIALSLPAAHIVDGAVAEAIGTFALHVAYAVTGVSIVFWMMTRYSRVELEWARQGARIVAALIFLAGSSLSLGRLGLPVIVSLAAAPLVALCYVILAGHSYRALSNRNENASLAPHYVALATLLWLIGGGFYGVLSMQPGIAAALRDTQLEAAGTWLAQWIAVSVVLAFVNEAASTLRGDNRRVTGYVPLWLMAFGVGLAGIMAVCRGVVEIYLRNAAAMTAADITEQLLPLTLIWIICLLAVAAGIATYALGFWLRLPRIRVVEA